MIVSVKLLNHTKFNENEIEFKTISSVIHFKFHTLGRMIKLYTYSKRIY